MLNILVTGDWHITNSDLTWLGRKPAKGDQAFGVNQLRTIVETRKPQIVVLVGDIFDTPRINSEAIEKLQSFIRSCQKVGSKLYFVQGQHDYSNPPLLTAINNYAEHIHERVIEGALFGNFGNLKFAGADIYRDDDQTIFNWLEPYENDTVILFTHQVWKEFVPFKWSLSAISLPKQVKIIISGDYHKPTAIKCTDERYLISPGPITARAIDQTDPKSVIWLEIKEGPEAIINDISIKRIPIKSRPVYNALITTTEQAVEFIKKIHQENPDMSLPEEIRIPIVRIRYTNDVKPFEHQLKELEEHVMLDLQHIPDEDLAPEIPEDVDENLEIETAINELAEDEQTASLAMKCWKSGPDVMLSYIETGESDANNQGKNQ